MSRIRRGAGRPAAPRPRRATPYRRYRRASETRGNRALFGQAARLLARLGGKRTKVDLGLGGGAAQLAATAGKANNFHRIRAFRDSVERLTGLDMGTQWWR